ncbi:MAG: hypothetical protein ACYDGN_02715 [Acidimicrobiales bacterium]
MVDVSAPRLGLTKRTLPRSRGEDAEQALGRFVRAECWNGLTSGEVVRVAGHSARGRHWRFRAHVTNTSNGASWVEVALVEGPPPSRRLAVPDAPARVERVRSFSPELISPRWRRRHRRHRQQSQQSQADQQSLF